MHNPRTHGPFADATSVVYGVATARMATNHAGAQLLMRRHLEEAAAAGIPETEALSMLFSAAIVALTDEMTTRARVVGKSPAALLTNAALAHAYAKVGS